MQFNIFQYFVKSQLTGNYIKLKRESLCNAWTYIRNQETLKLDQHIHSIFLIKFANQPPPISAYY